MKELSDKQEEIIVQKMQAELHLQDHAQRNEADQKRLQELKRQVGFFIISGSFQLAVARRNGETT